MKALTFIIYLPNYSKGMLILFHKKIRYTFEILLENCLFKIFKHFYDLCA